MGEISCAASTVIEHTEFLKTCTVLYIHFFIKKENNTFFQTFIQVEFSSTLTLKQINMSAIRQNYAEASEAAINKQINMELYASYVYMSMAYHFDRDDVALEGFHKYFKKSSDEENYLAEQVDAINEISKMITNAKRCGDGLGIYQFDKLTMQS